MTAVPMAPSVTMVRDGSAHVNCGGEDKSAWKFVRPF